MSVLLSAKLKFLYEYTKELEEVKGFIPTTVAETQEKDNKQLSKP